MCGRVRQIAVAVLLAASVTVPTEVKAFDLFGIHLFGKKKEAEAPSPDAQPYTLELTVTAGGKELLNRIRGSSLLYEEREGRPPPSTPAFLSRVMAEYGRIVAGLYTEGYYGGVVTITVDGRDPATIPRDAKLPDPVPVVITVDPGPLFTFGRLTIRNRAPANPSLDVTPAKTLDELGFVTGGVARSGIVLGAEEALVREWRQLGYPKAAVAKRDVLANHPTSKLDVTIDLAPGRRAILGPITVTGTARMDAAFVLRQSGLKPGQAYSPAELARAQKRLQRLQVFSAIRIVEADKIRPDGTLPLTITVVERPRHVIGGGISYSTVDGVGVEAYWEDRNLFGHAERLRIEGRVAGAESIDPKDYTYSLGATFTKPGVFNPNTDLVALALARREVLDAYTEELIRGRIGLNRIFTDRLTGSIAANFEWAHDDDALGEREYLFASLPASLTYDGRNNVLEPTRGIRARLDVEPFYEFEHSNAGVITNLVGSTYLALGAKDRVVLAVRGGIGSIAGAPLIGVPDGRLFFLGGGNSIRGYAYRNVGPRLPNGDIIGGRSYVEGTLEARVKVTEKIGVVPFIDVGNAFESSFPDFSQEMKVGVGLGLRYQTGVGPIRLDVAVPLNRDHGDPSVAIYVGLGEAF